MTADELIVLIKIGTVMMLLYGVYKTIRCIYEVGRIRGSSENLDKNQTQAIKCAYADMVGALQAFRQQDTYVHDWKAHLVSIEELEEAFPFIEPVEIKDE